MRFWGGGWGWGTGGGSRTKAFSCLKTISENLANLLSFMSFLLIIPLIPHSKHLPNVSLISTQLSVKIIRMYLWERCVGVLFNLVIWWKKSPIFWWCGLSGSFVETFSLLLPPSVPLSFRANPCRSPRILTARPASSRHR